MMMAIEDDGADDTDDVAAGDTDDEDEDDDGDDDDNDDADDDADAVMMMMLMLMMMMILGIALLKPVKIMILFNDDKIMIHVRRLRQLKNNDSITNWMHCLA